MRLTIDEYSKKFKMSKEMVKSKLRSKKLNYIMENGITYIIVTKGPETTQITSEQTAQTKAIAKPKTTVATVIALYQRENTQLKEKIMQLESKIDRLIDDKEQMLRDERDKIEQVYANKDEQLKNILELVNAKMMLDQQHQTIHEVPTLEVEAHTKQKQQDKNSELVELREYLKSMSIKSYQKKIIKKRFLSVYDSDIRIKQKNGKLYLNFSKYDYSDLLAY